MGTDLYSYIPYCNRVVFNADEVKDPFNSLRSDCGQKWVPEGVGGFVEQRIPEVETVLVCPGGGWVSLHAQGSARAGRLIWERWFGEADLGRMIWGDWFGKDDLGWLIWGGWFRVGWFEEDDLGWLIWGDWYEVADLEWLIWGGWFGVADLRRIIWGGHPCAVTGHSQPIHHRNSVCSGLASPWHLCQHNILLSPAVMSNHSWLSLSRSFVMCSGSREHHRGSWAAHSEGPADPIFNHCTALPLNCSSSSSYPAGNSIHG